MTSGISSLQAGILRELLVDGRKSASEIAEKIGTSKDTVQANISEMKQNGIIQGATIHFNYRGFGYFAVAYMLVTVDPAQADQMIEHARKMPDIYAAIKLGQKGNLRVVATLRTLKQLDEIKDALKQKFSISSLKTVIWTDVKEMHENLRLYQEEEHPKKTEKEEVKQVLSKRPESKGKFDEVDFKIIDELSKDGLVSFSDIAERIGVSSNTVKKRYENLTKKGMIKVTIQIDPAKAGYRALAIFFVTFTLHVDTRSMVERISQIPDVISIMKTSGDYDLQVYVMVRDINQLFSLQDEFDEIAGVAKVEMDLDKLLNKWPTPRQYISTF